MAEKHAGISVIIPVYQTEVYVEDCVRSVMAQTFSDWEIILVDDGSPDGAGAICDRLAGEDDRIRVFHQKNGGVGNARNHGLREASGTYLTFLDSDDTLAPEALERMLTLLKESEADLVYVSLAELSGGVLKLAGSPMESPVMNSRRFLTEALSDRYGSCLPCGGWLIPSELVKDRFFAEDLPYGEDSLYICGALKKAEYVCFVPLPLYLYRTDRAGNTATLVSFRKAERTYEARKRMRELFADGEENRTVYRAFTRTLADTAVACCRQAHAEHIREAKRSYRNEAGRLWRELMAFPEVSVKDKLRLGLAALSPIRGVDLWLRISGKR